MRFGLLYHHQVPRPWSAESEERTLMESLEQIELADKLGFDCAWATEHHFLDEYSHSSAPEVFLGAAAARTSRIRLGHGIVSLPPAMNHPARVAERIATLDLISGGRVEFGTGQGSSQMEVEAFGVAKATKRDQWTEAIKVITRMMTEVPFTGHQGTWVDMPPRNVLPKPKQKPHPPLWVACSNPTTVEFAARNGLGALALAFVSIEEAREYADAYYRAIASSDCVPIGFDVNPNLAVVMPFMCAPDDETALDRGLDGAHFFAYAFMHYYFIGEHAPGTTNISDLFEQGREMFAMVREPNPEVLAAMAAMDPTLEKRLDALRRGMGSPEKLRPMIRAYEDAGIDQIIFQVQLGHVRHEHIMESLELFAREVMPEFAQRREARDAAKNARLKDAIEAALARIERKEVDVSDYTVDADMGVIQYTAPGSTAA
ncbi:LLM class flavin-dependent oxidoreductase [Catellatospora tritici]|uniref:LLM class flavin-dependent oxidoreductase n=1 Tax=Catellatospora tritici TaxID=2851566 RepID=UPI001C2D98C1|nr:LLM class flavin-dependent oxidoreductase [Catellatospora tritici]MBV1855118.1 LLM class flavin-dependent oxidoreductase [Catellatospora tritici]